MSEEKSTSEPVICTPLPIPEVPADFSIPKLTPEEEDKYSQVHKHFDHPEYQLVGEDKNQSPLMDEEKFWLTRECMLRFLRATKWDVDATIKRLENTLQWRRQYGLYDRIKADILEPEAVTGKQVVFGYDVSRRPGLYLFPSRQNTTDPVPQIQFTVFMLEKTIQLAGPGVESIALFINFADRAKNPTLATSREVLNILQNHYPERLGKAFIINIPFLINAFFKIIMPFVDPVTRDKVKFNPNVIGDGLMDPDQLMNAVGWGGNQNFAYEHEKYWAALNKLCDETREVQYKRWTDLGKKIGANEWELKTGEPFEQKKVEQALAPTQVDKAVSAE